MSKLTTLALGDTSVVSLVLPSHEGLCQAASVWVITGEHMEITQRDRCRHDGQRLIQELPSSWSISIPSIGNLWHNSNKENLSVIRSQNDRLSHMSNGSREVFDIGRFVRARREATSASTYIETSTRRRHVSHLTQRDLADLIGMSTVVISQIEQGRYPNLSRAILQKIARALEFSQQQEIYLLGLFDERPSQQISPDLAPEWLHTSIRLIAHPVMLVNPAYDMISINEKGMALFSETHPNIATERNSARFIFNVPAARDFTVEWEAYAASLVSGMKVSYAMFPGWRDYVDGIAQELCSTDEYFNRLWHLDDPLVRPTFDKQFDHPSAGILNVKQILSDIVDVPGLTRIDFIPVDGETRRKFEHMVPKLAGTPRSSEP